MSGRWWAERLSVVIPTFNRGDLLLRVLAAFASQTLPADRFEVLVVDDGSTDETPARLAAYQAEAPYPLTVLRQANQGPAAARNTGLAAARGEVVVFIDDDCIPEPRLLAEHRASHEVVGLAVIGRIAWHPDLPVTPFMRYVESDLFAYSNITVGFDAPFACFYTGNASVHRASALAIGGFDTDFPRATHEDIDFAYRLRGQGVRFVFNPAAVVGHYRPMELGPTLAFQRVKGQELIRLWAKHPELRSFMPVAPLIDPAVRERFYQAVMTYYLALGMQDGLADRHTFDPDETLPAWLEEYRQDWADRRVEALQNEIRDLRAELARREESRRWAEGVQQEYARLERAYQEQAAWAAELSQRLAARPVTNVVQAIVHRLRALVRRR
jgi:glycosyltransferase involved in cell wall biosynthesis